MRTDACVRYAPEAIACAAISLAAARIGFPLPAQPWQRALATSEEEVEEVARVIESVYALDAPLGWLPSLRADWRAADDDEPEERDAPPAA
jgi:hypothetical protein